MDCYYSCQGKYMCLPVSYIETFGQSSCNGTQCYVIVIIIQDANGVVLTQQTASFQYTEGNMLSQDQSNIAQVSSLPNVLNTPLTVIVQDLTQYQSGNIPFYLAIDFSYYNGTTESSANYRSSNNPTTVMQFNNAGINSLGQRQYSYQFTPIGQIHMMYFDFDPLHRLPYIAIM